MNSAIGKQVLVGAVVGVFLSGGIWYYMKGMREELQGLQTTNTNLVDEVERGKRLKASYEILRKEVEEQEKRIADLVALLTPETERSRVAYMIQKLASASALGQVQGWVPSDKPVSSQYYKEYPTVYKYSGGFWSFGKFLEFASGFDKIINISDIVMTRDTRARVYPASIEFRLSVFVYDPKGDEKSKSQPGKAPGA